MASGAKGRGITDKVWSSRRQPLSDSLLFKGARVIRVENGRLSNPRVGEELVVVRVLSERGPEPIAKWPYYFEARYVSDWKLVILSIWDVKPVGALRNDS